MALELIKQSIRVNQAIGEDTTQSIIENDIIVPDIKPDIARILLLDGDAIVDGAEAAQDKILINGTIRYKILYVSDDEEQPIKSINSTAAFRYAMNIPSIRQGMSCKANCDIEHIEYEIINSRKINVKTILNIDGKAENKIDQSFVTGFEGVDGIQTQKNRITLKSFIGFAEAEAVFEETLEVPSGKPAIREILRNDIKITGMDYKLTEGKIIAKGDINVSTLYIGDDESRSIQFMEHEFPFTQFIEQAGIDEDTLCELKYTVKDLAFEPEEDSDGELRFQKAQVKLGISADCFERKDVEYIEDAYSTASRISLDKDVVKIEETAAENKSQAILKENIIINDDCPDISEIFNVLYKPSISECTISDDKLTIAGVLCSNILYLAGDNEQPVYCFEQDVPFNQGIDIKGINGEMGCDIDMNIEHCSYSIVSAREVEIRIVLGISARILNHVTIPNITKVQELSGDDKLRSSQPSVIIYFVQRGDNLWKIAKKYSTTMEDIKKINALSDSNILIPGGQVIIPGRITTNF